MEKAGWLERLSHGVSRLALACFLVIVVITGIEVVSRYVFDAPTIWVHEISVVLAAMAFMLGGPVIHQSRSHIVISALYERFSPLTKRRVNVLVSFLSLIFLVVLAYAAGKQAYLSLGLDEGAGLERSGTALDWPTPVISKVLFALVAALMVVQTLVHLRQDLRRLIDR